MRGFSCSALLIFAALLGADEPPAELLQKSQADLLAGRYATALDQCRRAAEAFRRSGDRTNEARALTGAGLAQLYSGDYREALAHFDRAVEISRAIGDRPGEVTRLNNSGTAQYYLGRYADAMAAYQQAKAVVDANSGAPWHGARRQLTMGNIAMLYQTLGQYEHALDIYAGLLREPGEMPERERAQLLNNAGSLRRRLGDPAKALATYREVQQLYAKAAHRDGEVAVLNNIGIVQAMDLRDYSSAIATFTKALERSRGTPLAVHARLYRGEAEYRAGKLAESGGDFEAALEEARRLGEKEETWKSLYGLARVQAASGDVPQADRLLEQAAAVIESLRADLGGPALRSEFLADKRDVYDLLIEHATDPRVAFRYMEQSRARDIRDRLRILPSLDLDRVAAGLSRDEMVLDYWVGRSSAAVLWIAAGKFGLKRLSMTPGDVDSLNALCEALADPAKPGWRAEAERVSRWLGFAPAIGGADIRHVRIVPDGPLARVPFEVLPLDGATLAVEKLGISYSQSLSILPTAHARRTIWPWQTGLKAVADPAPGPGAPLSGARSWGRLPEAAREVSQIARELGARAEVSAGAEAFKSRLTAGASAPLLHIASHAFSDPRDPDRSYVLFAPPSNAARYDYLYRREVFDLPLSDVDLVTVSACETDAGKSVAGEGEQNFTGAFVAAGAKSVVASQWKVDDRATAELMIRFYQRLAEGLGKAEALRHAKLAFLHSPPVSHPYYWAAFVLHGEALPPIPRIVRWWHLLAVAAATAAILTILARTVSR